MLTFQCFCQKKLIHVQNKHTGLQKTEVMPIAVTRTHTHKSIIKSHLSTQVLTQMSNHTCSISRSDTEVDWGRLFCLVLLMHLWVNNLISYEEPHFKFCFTWCTESLHSNLFVCHLCSIPLRILVEILRNQSHKCIYNNMQSQFLAICFIFFSRKCFRCSVCHSLPFCS